MPVHDWSKVNAGIFHSFHTSWIVNLSNSLNGGLLPAGYYALAEQVARPIGPDNLTLQSSWPAKPGSSPPSGKSVALLEKPPKVRVI